MIIIQALCLRNSLRKFEDKIQLENVLLVSKYFNDILPSIFKKTGSHFVLDVHNHDAAAFSLGKLCKPSFQTNLYGKNSITMDAVNA